MIFVDEDLLDRTTEAVRKGMRDINKRMAVAKNAAERSAISREREKLTRVWELAFGFHIMAQRGDARFIKGDDGE